MTCGRRYWPFNLLLFTFPGVWGNARWIGHSLLLHRLLFQIWILRCPDLKHSLHLFSYLWWCEIWEVYCEGGWFLSCHVHFFILHNNIYTTYSIIMVRYFKFGTMIFKLGPFLSSFHIIILYSAKITLSFHYSFHLSWRLLFSTCNNELFHGEFLIFICVIIFYL